MVSFGNDELMPHFIYCGNYYQTERVENFKEIILEEMKKIGIQSSMLTMLYMGRDELITKEKAKEVWDGKLENEKAPIYFPHRIYQVQLFYAQIFSPKFLPRNLSHPWQTVQLGNSWGPPGGEISINDDLEKFRRNLLNSKEIKVGCKQFSTKKNFD